MKSLISRLLVTYPTKIEQTIGESVVDVVDCVGFEACGHGADANQDFVKNLRRPYFVGISSLQHMLKKEIVPYPLTVAFLYAFFLAKKPFCSFEIWELFHLSYLEAGSS